MGIFTKKIWRFKDVEKYKINIFDSVLNNDIDEFHDQINDFLKIFSYIGNIIKKGDVKVFEENYSQVFNFLGKLNGQKKVLNDLHKTVDKLIVKEILDFDSKRKLSGNVEVKVLLPDLSFLRTTYDHLIENIFILSDVLNAYLSVKPVNISLIQRAFAEIEKLKEFIDKDTTTLKEINSDNVKYLKPDQQSKPA
jgi:hypothetical protein